MMLHRRTSFFLLVVLLLACVHVQAQTQDRLADRIDALLEDPCLNHGIQGVIVESVQDGRIIYRRNADAAMIPASCLKLIVSAVALDRLGPNYTFHTGVYVCSLPDSAGVVRGDVVLRGGGDPVLATQDLVDMVLEMKAKGVSKISGNILVDDTLFDSQRHPWGWSWDDLPYYYSAPVSALNLNRNVVDVYVYPGKSPGVPAIVRTIPSVDCLSIQSTATTAKPTAKKSVWVYRKLGQDVITVGGCVPLGYSPASYEEKITVTDPALYAGEVFLTALEKAGVTVVGSVQRAAKPNHCGLIVEHQSPPLSEMIKLMNKPSDNLIAEVLLKNVAVAADGLGTSKAGIEAELEFCKSIGMDMSALQLHDGSGLSRRNYISPYNLSVLISHMKSHKYGKQFVNSLPVAGEDGTLRNRMETIAPAVRAKTGYVSNVSTLCGYLETQRGVLCITIMMNNHLCNNSEAKSVQDRLCELLVHEFSAVEAD